MKPRSAEPSQTSASDTSVRIRPPGWVINCATPMPMSMLPTTSAAVKMNVVANECRNSSSASSAVYWANPTGSKRPVNRERTSKSVKEATTSRASGTNVIAVMMTSAGAVIANGAWLRRLGRCVLALVWCG